MKKIFFRIVLLAFIFPSVNFVKAQTAAKTWTKNPFNQKIFIENKTQFDGSDNLPNSNILFGVWNDGIQIYFTPKGVTFRHDKFVEMTEAEKEIAEKSGSKMEPEMMRKKKTDCVNMEWKNANPNVQIIAENAVSNYFTYGDLRDKSGKTSIKALAYKKIMYKNLYPNIDVEYSFPENKSGIKYTIILHPGANAALIKMAYSENGKINVDENGNANITSNFGNIIDHAPITQYEAGKNIFSKFIFTNNILAFKLENYDRSKTVIIDPWITVPTYTSSNKAYDVDADLAGNVYIYGGSDNGANPYQEIKLNSSGTILWTYTATVIDSNGYYGDFAVDGHSQSSYLVEGANFNGAEVAKVNALGLQIGLSVGNPNLQEMWRITFNNTTRTGVIGAGGTSAPNQACILDTTLANIIPINILGASDGFHDMALLAQDNNNNCYMSPATGNVAFSNEILKATMPSLLPTAYMVPDGYNFQELNSVMYTTDNDTMGPNTNGFNGMAVNTNYLYTYDGSILKKWKAATGVLLDTVKVAIAITDSTFSWGGLQTDRCDDVFAGAGNSIKQYDGNLNLITTIPAADTVYDLKLGAGNLLYACGKGFVQSIPLSLPICNSFSLTISATNGCLPVNSATVTAIGGGSSAYTYSWSTNPVQTTPTATGLSSGTYYVTVTNNFYTPPTEVDSVTIISNAATASFTANPTNGEAPLQVNFTNTSTDATIYEWVFGNGDTSNLFDANTTYQNAGQYTVELIATNTHGCSDTAFATIDVDTKSILIIPNIFSPNGDEKNDVFRMQSSGISTFDAQIFDRWGIKLYEWNNVNTGWNGKIKSGDDAPDGTYYYLINATGVDGKKYTEKGFLTLLR